MRTIASMIVLASIFVFTSDSYVSIFYLSIIPYAIGIVNFLGYPQEVDVVRADGASLRHVVAHLVETLKRSIAARPTRRWPDPGRTPPGSRPRLCSGWA